MRRSAGFALACVALLAPAPASPAQTGDVVLPAKEFQALREQADELRRLQAAPKVAGPAPPSECRLAVRLEAPAGLTVAVVSATYTFQAPAPRSPVLLGGKGALPRAARLPGGKAPALAAEADGLVLLPDAAGPGEVTVDWELPVLARPGGAEVGFELGLPRAAVTTLTAELPDGGRGAAVTARAGEARRAPYRPGAALGPAESVEVAWPAPAAAVAEAGPTVESDVSVRVDENRVETTAKLRLKGARDWPLYLPAGSDVSVERVGGAGLPGPFTGAATVRRPDDANRPLWQIQVPGGASDWLVTAVHRQPRPRPADPKARPASVTVGPVAVANAARHSGTLRVDAPPLVRVGVKAGADLRRQDLPAGAGEEFQALFRFTQSPAAAGKAPPPLAELELRPARGFVRLEPTYRLQLTRAGWRLTAELRVVPVRSEVDSLLIEWPGASPSSVEVSAPRPAGAEAGPADLVADVEVLREANPRTLAVRLESPQKGPFDLALTATFPAPPAARDFALALPVFPQVTERAARLTVAAPEGVELRGSARARDGDAADLRPAAGAPAAAQFEGGLERVELAWQAYRPALAARLHAEVDLGERQAKVTQTVALRPADGGAWRPVRFRGPAAAVGVQSPNLEPAGPGEWELPAPPAGAREATQTITYALPLPPRARDGSPARLDVPLFWPDEATRTETTVRVWGGPGARRVARFDGPWREVAPEADAARDAWPWLTLAGGGDRLKLAIDLLDPSESPSPQLWVERALIQARLGRDDQVTVAGRYLIRRWGGAGAEVKLPPGAAPRVLVDDRPADNLLPGADGAVRVPLRDPKAGGPWLRLDVAYTAPQPRGAWDATTLAPPELVGAAYRDGARWQVSAPPEDVALLAGGERPEVRWGWRRGGFGPLAGATDAELDAWLLAPMEGAIPAASGASGADALTFRQPAPGPAAVRRLPRAAWVAANSLLALLAAVGAARLSPARRPLALAPLAALLAGAVLLAPQPAGEALAAAEPGLAAGAVAVLAQGAWQRFRRRQVTHLPGFTRSRPEVVLPPDDFGPPPSAAGSAGRGSRPSLAPVPSPLTGSERGR